MLLPTVSASVALLLATTAVQPDDFSKRLPKQLLTVPGEVAAVRYSPGNLDRANHVARRLDVIAADLRDRIKGTAPLIGVVLSRREWEEAGFELPYGLPMLMGAGSVAIPAAGDDTTARRWKTWLGTDLPPVEGVPMVGTAENASSLVLADLLLQRAACAFILGRASFASPEPWIQALLSQFAAYNLFQIYEPSRVAEIELVYRRLRENLPVLLEIDRDRAPGVEGWLLREAQYFEGAALMYEHAGRKGLNRLIKRVREQGAPLSRQLLLELHPELAPWLASVSENLGIS